MAALALCLGLLAIPAGHQLVAHRAVLKAVRAMFRPHSPAVAPAPHELAHRERSRPLRLAADGAWLAYLAGVLVLAVVLH